MGKISFVQWKAVSKPQQKHCMDGSRRFGSKSHTEIHKVYRLMGRKKVLGVPVHSAAVFESIMHVCFGEGKGPLPSILENLVYMKVCAEVPLHTKCMIEHD